MSSKADRYYRAKGAPESFLKAHKEGLIEVTGQEHYDKMVQDMRGAMKNIMFICKTDKQFLSKQQARMFVVDETVLRMVDEQKISLTETSMISMTVQVVFDDLDADGAFDGYYD